METSSLQEGDRVIRSGYYWTNVGPSYYRCGTITGTGNLISVRWDDLKFECYYSRYEAQIFRKLSPLELLAESADVPTGHQPPLK